MISKGFWCQGNDTKKNLQLCHVHIAQLMAHLAVYALPFTLQFCYKPLGILQRVTKSQKVHILSHVLQKFHSIDFAKHNSLGFLMQGVEKQEYPAFPLAFLTKIKKVVPKIWESIHHMKWGEVSLLIPRHVVDISFVLKTFKFSSHLTCID